MVRSPPCSKNSYNLIFSKCISSSDWLLGSCKVLDVSSIGPLPRLTLSFWTSIRTHLSLTMMCGCRCRVHTPVGWSVPHIDAHNKKNESQLRSAALQDWGKKKGSDALRAQVLTVYSTMASIILLFCSILSALDLQTWPNHEELPSNPPSKISLITSKMPYCPGPRVEAVSSASCPCHLHRSQECCLVMEGSSYSATLGNAQASKMHTGDRKMVYKLWKSLEPKVWDEIWYDMQCSMLWATLP